MNKKVYVLICIMVVITLGSIGITTLINQKEGKSPSEKQITDPNMNNNQDQIKDQVKNKKLKIVTTFYPIYILAKNVVGEISDVELLSLSQFQVGCLHDYQLTTSDMKNLDGADILIMNGGGMENFIDKILVSYPAMQIINTSQGIEYLAGAENGHDHEHDHDQLNGGSDEDSHEEDTAHEEEAAHDHGDYNAHVWLNLDYYLHQIQETIDGLSEYDKANAAEYKLNGERYEEKIKLLQKELKTDLSNPDYHEIVIFHDAFAYLAQEIGLEVVYTVNMDSDTSLSAGEIAHIMDEVDYHQIKVLFTEEQYSTAIAEGIAKETGARAYVIDTMVTGDLSKDAYINAMRKNIEILKSALYAN